MTVTKYITQELGVASSYDTRHGVLLAQYIMVVVISGVTKGLWAYQEESISTTWGRKSQASEVSLQ